MFQTDRERKFSNHEVVSESEDPLLCRRRGRRPGGSQVAKSPKTRELCVAGMAKGMKLQQDARVTLQNMKEDAQDLCAEAKQKAAQETAEEA